MRKQVYNLEFPSGCQSMTIFDYKFVKVKDYPIQLQKLQQLVAYYADVQIKLNTGEHAITAYVELPKTEQKAVLEWGNTNSTALEDILLLLSIFTHRNVFVVDQKEKDSIIIADPRQHPWGEYYLVLSPIRKINLVSPVNLAPLFILAILVLKRTSPKFIL